MEDAGTQSPLDVGQGGHGVGRWGTGGHNETTHDVRSGGGVVEVLKPVALVTAAGRGAGPILMKLDIPGQEAGGRPLVGWQPFLVPHPGIPFAERIPDTGDDQRQLDAGELVPGKKRVMCLQKGTGRSIIQLADDSVLSLGGGNNRPFCPVHALGGVAGGGLPELPRPRAATTRYRGKHNGVLVWKSVGGSRRRKMGQQEQKKRRGVGQCHCGGQRSQPQNMNNNFRQVLVLFCE